MKWKISHYPQSAIICYDLKMVLPKSSSVSFFAVRTRFWEKTTQILNWLRRPDWHTSEDSLTRGYTRKITVNFKNKTSFSTQ